VKENVGLLNMWMGVAVCCHWASHRFVHNYLRDGDMQARIAMRTIGVANITHLIEIKKCSHQAMLIKLGVRARHDWERVEQNNVKWRTNCLPALVYGVLWLVQEERREGGEARQWGGGGG